MKVWILTGEFALSDNGEVWWVEGVYKTREAAIAAAKLVAQGDEHQGKKVLVDGLMEGSAWTEEEVEDDNDMDWEVSFRVDDWEVMGA